MGAWTDLYALGIVAYECLTGEHPYEGKSQSFALAKVLADESLTLPPEYQDGPLAPIITKLLQKKIEDRYQDCDELIADLNRLETKEDRLARKSHEPPQLEEPLGADTQGAPWISELLARQEFDETQTIRPNLFDPIEDKKTQTFQREDVLPPASLVPRETIVAAEISPDSRVLELESGHTTHPFPSADASSGMGKFILAFLVLVLLGGGIAGGVLMTLDSPPLEKEVVLHTKQAHASGPSPEHTNAPPVDPGLVAKAATGRVADALEQARIELTSSGEAVAAKTETKEATPAALPKQPRVADSSRKATAPKEKVAKKAPVKETSSSPKVTKEAGQTSPAAKVKEDANTTTTASEPRLKETSPAPPEKKEKEEYRFFGVP